MAGQPIRPTDDEARAMAHALMEKARHGALATLREGGPHVSRIALARDGADLLTLISDLAPHTQALRDTPRASLLIGEPGKGDPLAHPRLSLTVEAQFIDKSSAAECYLAQQPKAKLYIGFADFHLVRFVPRAAELNGGFGKAYHLTAADLTV